MEPESEEWMIEADDELIDDYEQNADKFISTDHLILAAKALGHSEEDAYAMVLNAKAHTIQHYPRFHLFRVLRSGRLDELPAALEGAVMRTVFVDNCQVFYFCMDNVPPFDDRQINQIRMGLADYYPDDLEYVELIVGPEEGKHLRFRSYDLISFNKVKEIFKVYDEWFIKKTEQISPQFETVKKEIRKFLKEKYWIEPQKEGFINWLLMQKLGSLSINFRLDFKNGVEVNNSKVPISFNYKIDDRDYMNIERHIQEYCSWKRDQLETNDKKLEEEKKLLEANSLHQMQLASAGRLFEPQTIFDIWEEEIDKESNKAYYNEVINKLIENNYVQRVSNKLQWRKQKGYVSYCAGFMQTCINKGWIRDAYTAPDLVKLLNNSLNIGIKSTTTFKTDALYSLDIKYTAPFQSMCQKSK